METTPLRWSREEMTNQSPATHLKQANPNGLFLFQHDMRQSLAELAHDQRQPFVMELSTLQVQPGGFMLLKAAQERFCGEKISLLILALTEQHTPRRSRGDDQARHLSRKTWLLPPPVGQEKQQSFKTSTAVLLPPQRHPMFRLSPMIEQQVIWHGWLVRNRLPTRHHKCFV